ncbi:HxHSH motif-containing lipoprotein [Metamycoplasma gateae]|uniref:Lipoprotein n=1 Tax=Metamycoplasma gateae TaxID=35769 RepID=A0ABZ2AHK0_9BACT|nr:hypothetical protein V2E26_01245 [Metamycoplasma gateae]
MKKIKKILLPLFTLLTPLPLITISCIEYPNDKEDLSLGSSLDNKDNTKEIQLKNISTNNIKEIYLKKISKIFTSVKNTYRNYRKYYYKFIRKIEAFKNKVSALIVDQGNPKNAEAIQNFYQKWLENFGKEKTKLAKLFDKYQLIFQDVDAVLNDVNLVFDNQQFLKFIEIIDKRLSGIDINLGELQKAINSSWDFLKNNLFNKSKISTIDNLETINIESDKNSHSHSHAIINLIFEMGLWHLLLKKNVKDENLINEFKNDFLILKDNVIDNIGQKNYESDFEFIINLFENDMDFNQENNLININFQEESTSSLNQIKEILLSIAKQEGIDKNINLE